MKFSHYGAVLTITAVFPDDPAGCAAANAYMETCNEGVVTCFEGEILLARMDDVPPMTSVQPDSHWVSR